MKLAAKITCHLLLIATVLSCGDQKDTQVNPVADNAIVKDSSKASDSAEAQLVAGQKPLSAFSYSKEKITAEEKKFFSKFDKDARDDSPHLKIDLDPKAIFELLRKGGVLRVALKGERVIDFEFKASEPNGMGAVGGSSRIAENGKGDYSELSIGATESGVSMTIQTLEREYQVYESPTSKAYFLIHLDPNKRVSHHGTDPNRWQPVGGPPIPVPPKQEQPNVGPSKGSAPVPTLELGLKKKAVTSGVNIRVGFVIAPQAASELATSNTLAASLLQGMDWLSTAMMASSTGVTFTVVGPPEPIGITDYGKPLESILRELNAPMPIRADVAAFRLKNDVDILIVIVGASRGPTEDVGGYALIRGNALESTIVVTNAALTTNKIAHEVGHLLGADHHTLQRSSTRDVAPHYGHITPASPEFLGANRKTDIMIDTNETMWQCTGSGTIPCKQEKVFSDPTLVARTTFIDSGFAEAAGCAWQSPFGASQCGVNQCQTYRACPYPLVYGRCSFLDLGAPRFPPIPVSSANTFCVPKSKYVGLWSISQFYGVENVSNVASLWKSPRAAEVASFRDAARPFLNSAISSAIAPALLLLL